MALSTATVSFDLEDILGADFDPKGVRIDVTTNVANDTLIDTEGNKIRLGSGKVDIANDGTGAATVWVPGSGANPASWQTYFHVDYRDRVAHGGRAKRTFGPYTITADANLADLEDEQAVPPEYVTTLTAELDGYVTDAAASAAIAQGAADLASAITGLDNADDAITVLDANPASDFRVAQDARLSATIDEAMTRVRRSDTLAIIGTSITAQNGTMTAVPGGAGHLGYQSTEQPSGVQLLQPAGYWHWAAVMSRHRLTLIKNAGIGGNTTTQMLARFGADILALDPLPGWLMIEPGPNDGGNLVPAATSIANITSMIGQAQTAGMRVILATITPSNTLTTQGNADRSAVNAWIKQVAPSLFPGLVIVDWSAPLTASTGGPLPAAFVNESGSYVHPAPYGATIMGGVLAARLNEELPLIDRLATDPTDPGNLMPNGFNNGAGTVADSSSVAPMAGGSITGTASLVARTDGIPGKWQSIAITAGTARMRSDNTATPAKWSPGDWVHGHIEFETAGDWSAVKSLAIAVEFLDGVGAAIKTAWGLPARSGDPANPYRPTGGVLFLPPAQIPAGAAYLRFFTLLTMNGTGPEATLRVGRRELRKV